MSVFILIPWFHPAYKAGGAIQSIANMVESMGNDVTEFKVFCSNKDLDGSLLQGIVFDKWVNYNLHTKVWYSSTNYILPVLKQGIKRKPVYYLNFSLNFE